MQKIIRPDDEHFVEWADFEYPWPKCPNCGTISNDEIAYLVSAPVRYCPHCGIRIKPPEIRRESNYE